LIAQTRYGTDDPDAAHQFLSSRYSTYRAVLGGDRENFRFALTGRSAGEIGLARLRHSATLDATSDPLDYLVFAVITEGAMEIAAGRDQVRAARGEVLMYAIGMPLTIAWDRFDIHVLDLPMAVVADQAAAQSGIDPADLRFEAMTPVSPTIGRYWRATVGMVNRELSAPDSALANPLVRASTLSMLAAAALSTFPNTAMTASGLSGPGRVAPAAVRRAIAYIDAHADQPMTVTDIADAAGLSARALQHAFKRHRDTTPLSYLARVRLQRAHHDLQAGDPTRGDTVTTIARRWGFTNPGRFATAYYAVYGQRPRHTLHT
jgi:AraC-like DNA-binding protein